MESGQSAGSDWACVELTPEQPLLRDTLGFRIFLVQAHSDSDDGRALRDDPLRFFRENIKAINVPEDDTHAMVLRVNAEIPANPRHQSQLWMVVPGSTTAACLHYKHPDDNTA
jgi:hypothetical protein